MATPAKCDQTSRDLSLRTLCNELAPIKDKLTKLGVQLEIPESTVHELLKKEDPLSAIVGEWLAGNTDVLPSWQSIVKALESDHVGATGLAKKIQNKYCKQEVDIKGKKGTDDNTSEKSSSMIDDDIEEDIQYCLERNLAKIIKAYSKYVDQLRILIEEAKVLPKDLRSFLITQSVYGKTYQGQSLSLLSDKKDELEKCTTISKIFDFLNSECTSFLNYDVYKEIRKRYNIDKQEEKQYKAHLKEFIHKHKISEFEKINPKLLTFPTKSEKLILKYNTEHTCKLAKIDNLKRAIARILKTRPSTLHIIDIKKGCICVTYLIPASLAKEVFVSDTIFTSQQEEEFRNMSVLWLECNNFKYDFEVKKKDTDFQEEIEVGKHMRIPVKDSIKPAEIGEDARESDTPFLTQEPYIPADIGMIQDAPLQHIIQSSDEDSAPLPLQISDDFQSPNMESSQPVIHSSVPHMIVHAQKVRAHNDHERQEQSPLEPDLMGEEENSGQTDREDRSISSGTESSSQTSYNSEEDSSPGLEDILPNNAPCSSNSADAAEVVVPSPTAKPSSSRKEKLMIPAKDAETFMPQPEQENIKDSDKKQARGYEDWMLSKIQKESPVITDTGQTLEPRTDTSSNEATVLESEDAIQTTTAQEETAISKSALTPEYKYNIAKSEFLKDSTWCKTELYSKGKLHLVTSMSLLTDVTQPTQQRTTSVVILLTVQNWKRECNYEAIATVTLYDEKAGQILKEKIEEPRQFHNNYVKFIVDMGLHQEIERSKSKKLQLRVKVRVDEHRTYKDYWKIYNLSCRD